MPYITTKDSENIYYEVKGEGRPIIFIHGFADDHNSFKIQQRALSKKYKIITYDQRGHGLSTKVNFGLNLERLAIDLCELMSQLELDDVVLVGWSMGASVIFEYIKKYGINKLLKICIVDKGPKIINDDNWQLGLYHGSYMIDDAMDDLDTIKNNWSKFSSNFINTMALNYSESQRKISIQKMIKNCPNAMYSLWNSMVEKDYRPILKKISIPTLIVFGGKSSFYSVEVGKYLHQEIKDSRLKTFENSTHLIILEEPIRFNKILEEFILENNK